MKVINLDKEIFEQACILCEKDFSYEEIVSILKSSNDVEKQIAILKLTQIQSFDDAKLLVSHLIGQNGPIRESVAVKLNEFFVNNNNVAMLDNINFYPQYIDAVCDVNPNICRAVIDFLPKLAYQNEIVNILMDKIENIYNRIDSPDIEQKNFLTVRLFNLYWALEALGVLISAYTNISLNPEKLSYFLNRAIEFDNYTINEKVARIVVCLPNFSFDAHLLSQLKSSQNFYVKRYFKN